MPRTNDDTWDLAAGVGATATGVAAYRATASQGPDALLDDPWAEPLVRAVGIERFVKLVDGQPDAEDDPAPMRRMMNEHMTVRTRFFDDFFTRASASGVRQAVILASGLDTRAYRLTWHTDAVVFEIDQPDVIEFKTRTLADFGAEPTATLRTVAIDLRDDWPAALQEAGFDPGIPTAWSAEGLLVYLPSDAQDRLFDNITALSAPGSLIATEHLDMSGMPEDWAEKLSERSRRSGATTNLVDLFYTGERNTAADYLASHGWETTIWTTKDAYEANGFEVPDGELATFGGDSGYLTATVK